jgi:hypothetical protein
MLMAGEGLCRLLVGRDREALLVDVTPLTLASIVARGEVAVTP